MQLAWVRTWMGAIGHWGARGNSTWQADGILDANVLMPTSGLVVSDKVHGTVSTHIYYILASPMYKKFGCLNPAIELIL